MTSDPPSLGELQPVTPAALDRLVRQCLAKDPDKRWQSAGDIARHLEGLREELRFPSSASRLAVPAAAPRSRGKRMAMLGAGALAFAAIAGGTFILGRRAAERPLPTFRRLTFRRGTVQRAAFTPDGQSVVYTARWDGGPLDVYSVRTDGVDSVVRDGLRGYRVQAVSSTNELALTRGYTLATAPLATGTPRSVLTGVSDAAWLPDGSGMAIVHDGVVECPAGQVIYRPPQGNPTLSGLSVSPQGDRIAFLEHTISHGFVVIVDRAGREKARSAFHNGLSTTVWARSGREVWFATDVEAVRAMDLKGRERSVLRSPRMQLQDITRDGRALLLLRDQTVRMNVKTPSDSAERDITYYGWSLAEDISADGRTVLFEEGGESDPQNGWAIFLRGADGSPPQKLTDGYRGRISPDGKWVAANIFPRNPSRDNPGGVFALVPTGPGEPRPLNIDNNQAIEIVGWLPDGSGVVLMTGEGEQLRGWLAKADGSPAAPITPPGWWVGEPSPDGKYVVAENGVSAHPDGILYLYSIDGQTKVPLPIDPAAWGIYGWHDARHLRVGPAKEGGLQAPDGLRLPRRVYLIDIQTGKAEPWMTFGADLPRAGLAAVARFHASADGKSYVYDYSTNLGTLYIADGLR
jgi:eukaryotic-like serine/threonine-protein kinase